MSVTEAVRMYRGSVEKKVGKNTLKAVFRHIICFVGGVLFGIAGINDELSPFGVAYTASVPKNYTLTAGVGAVCGSFVASDSVTALRYMSSILALCVIMGALKPFGQLRDNVYTPVILSFVCLFVTGTAIVFSQGVTAVKLLLCFAESAVGAASSLALTKSRCALSVKGGLSMLTSKEATSIVISVTLLLLSLSAFEVGGIYPIHIAAQVLVLICAYYGREAGGAIVGICGGVTMSIGTSNLFLLAFYSLGGLLAGVFSALGRVVTFLAFAVAGLAVAAVSYSQINVSATIIETVISSLLFFIVSHKFNSHLESVFVPSVASPIIDSVKSGIVSKLKKASEISEEICTSLTEVNTALAGAEKSDINLIPKKTREQICGSCGLYDVCWKENVFVTDKSFDSLLELKKSGVYLEYKTLPQQFASSCIRSENVSSNFNKLYSEYKIKERNDNRIKEIYNLAAGQFVNVASLLDSLCEDIDTDVRFDMDIAARVRAAASACGFEAGQCCCIINSLEKMTVEVEIKTPYDKTKIQALNTQLRIVTGRALENPSRERIDAGVKLIYKEKTEYKIISAGVQFNANGEKYSGDSFSTFEDNKGCFYGVICDGMGTGVKAALSSNLAVTLFEKLIKAGFGIKAAVKTVNTCLISKSGDECSVTLDVLVFDLFTGRAEFYKCGAADSVVKRRGIIKDVGFCSLPLGIVSDCEIGFGAGSLNTGDVIVMCSDGVRNEDMDYLKHALKGFDEGNVRNFTSELCENIRRSQPEKNDDMTVLTLAVTKNN